MNIYFVSSPDRKVFAWGQTTRSYKERHKDTDWNKLRTYLTARGEDLVLIGWYENVDILDHDIHRFLKKTPGVPFPKRGEWSAYDENMHSIESIQDIVQKELFIKEAKVKTQFKPYPYQKEFAVKAQAKWLEFLLFAKCRSGKSAMTLNYIVGSSHKVSLLVSYRKSPGGSWFKDVEKFDRFENIRIINMKNPSWKSDLKYYLECPELQVVLWSTVQGLQKSRLKELKEISGIDLLILDESHIGNSAKQFKNVRNKLITTPCLSISGTAYDQIWYSPEEHTYVYSYFEEQLDNKKGVYDPLRPKMIVKVKKYMSDAYRKIYGDDPDAMKNTFCLNEDKTEFLCPEIIRDFIHQNFAESHIRRKDRLFGKAQHILMCLPSVEACHLFAKMIEPYYLPFVVTSDTRRNEEDIEVFIQSHKEGKTITLTYEANVLGVTQELWDTIVNAKEGKSPEFWTQFAFRGGSGDKDWDVIDFCPQRSLESLMQYYATSSERNPELRNYNIVDFVPIFDYTDGERILTQDEISQIIASDATSSIRLMTGFLTSLDREKLKEFSMDLELKSSRRDVAKTAKVNDNDMNGKGNKVLVGGNTKDNVSKELVKLEKKKRETLKSIMESVPLVQLYELKKGTRIHNISSLTKSEFYVKITQDTDTVLERAFSEGVMDAKGYSYRLIQSCSQVENSMNQDETKTLFDLSVSKGSNETIPSRILEELCDPAYYKDGKTLIWGDPTGCHSSFMINRCGFSPENISVCDDKDTHRYLTTKIDSKISTLQSIYEPLSTMKMKIKNSLINPPYQAEGLKNTGKTAWDKGVPIVVELVEDGGWMCHVHPSAWRKPFNELNSLFKYQIHKLSIHNDAEGTKTFGANTRYDYYTIEKVDAYKPSLIRWEGEKDYVEFDLRGRDFLPNNEIDLWDLVSFFSREDGRYIVPDGLVMNATRSGHLNPGNKNLVEFKTDYPIVHKLHSNNEMEIAYSAIPHPKNQWQKKVMFSESRYIHAVYDDGIKGCSYHMTWSNVESEEEGLSIAHFINYNIGKRLVKSSKWGNFRTEQVMWRKIVNPYKVGVREGDSDDQIIQKYSDYRNVTFRGL